MDTKFKKVVHVDGLKGCIGRDVFVVFLNALTMGVWNAILGTDDTLHISVYCKDEIKMFLYESDANWYIGERCTAQAEALTKRSNVYRSIAHTLSKVNR
jgi:hypothetical protein